MNPLPLSLEQRNEKEWLSLCLKLNPGATGANNGRLYASASLFKMQLLYARANKCDQFFLLLQILLRHSRQHHQHHATLDNIAILQYCCQKVKYRCRGLNILAIGKQRILLSLTLHVEDGVGYYIAILIILYNIVNILQEMLL